VPMMVVSGQVKRADMLRNAPLRQKGVQEVDIVSMVGDVTKYAVVVENPEDIRQVMEEAYFLARDGRAGPVWIDVPLDVQAASIDRENLASWAPDKPVTTMTNGLNNKTITDIVTLLSEAERPLIIAGHGVRLAGGAKMFQAWVEDLGVPVVSTWNALDLLPFDHPLYVGRPGVVALRAPNFAVQNCDLLISIGCRLDNIITAFNPKGFAREAKKIVVDIDQNEIDKLDMDITTPIACDAAEFIKSLAESEVTFHSRWEPWRNRCVDWKKRYTVNDGKPFPHADIISHYQLMDALSEVIPENMLVSTGSSGLAVEAFYIVFRNKIGQRVFLTSGLGSMGYGLPAAIGACFANGLKPMVAIESDGSFQLNIQELATIASFNLPITIIVMNNDGYASIRNTQKNYFNERYVGTGPEAGLKLPDLKKIALAYELDYLKVEGVSELNEKLEKSIGSERPIIVDVQLIKNEVLMPKVSALPQPDGSIISMPLEDMTPLLSLEELRSEMLVSLVELSTKARVK